MRKFWVIAVWEFMKHLRSRNFLLATFISPLIFAGIVLIPSIYYEKSQASQNQVIGCVELDTTSYCQMISEQLAELYQHNDLHPRVLIEPIFPDTSTALRDDFFRLDTTRQRLDSLNEAYNKVKERRKYIFQRPASRNRTLQLSRSYEEMIRTRENRDLTEIEYNRLKMSLDSLLTEAVIKKADSLVEVKHVSGYLLIQPDRFREGEVEFHSRQPRSFLRLQFLEQAIQAVLIKQRMRQEGLSITQIQEYLRPIQIMEFLSEGKIKREFNFRITYLAPIVVVLFLFISIFTSSGYLFSSVIQEKSGKVVEPLLASVRTYQLLGGKLAGLGVLGLLQIFIWIAIVMLFVFTDIIPVKEYPFLNVHNAGIFILYFILGYLFFASIFAGVGSLSSSEQDAHNLTQVMRILSIFPIALVILVLLSPDSLLVRILSFIPFLTPTFMVLRTPLGEPPLVDYYISSGIMLFSIIVLILFSGRIYRLANLLYHQKPSFKGFATLLRAELQPAPVKKSSKPKSGPDSSKAASKKS